MSLPQLIMRHPDLSALPPLDLKDFTLHTHRDGDEPIWEEIIEDAFGTHFNFDFMIKAGGFQPEYLLYLCKDGKEIATAPGEGWFRMVGTRKEARGMGAGKTVCLAVLHGLKKRGYRSALLSTDDARIPAIRLYLSLGFHPHYTPESHEQRWAEVLKNIL